MEDFITFEKKVGCFLVFVSAVCNLRCIWSVISRDNKMSICVSNSANFYIFIPTLVGRFFWHPYLSLCIDIVPVENLVTGIKVPLPDN